MPKRNIQVGYTLIELLVVVAIITVISVIVMANYKDFSTDQVLSDGVSRIQSFLRLAQTNAASAVECMGGGNPVPATEWDVAFNSGDPSAPAPNPLGTLSLFCNNDPSSASAKSLVLPNNIIVSSVSFKKADMTNATCLDSNNTLQSYPYPQFPLLISYQPTFGKIKFILGQNNTCTISDAQYINITIQNNKGQKTFTITQGGAIDINMPSPTP